jgi:hypothetical protein
MKQVSSSSIDHGGGKRAPIGFRQQLRAISPLPYRRHIVSRDQAENQCDRQL